MNPSNHANGDEPDRPTRRELFRRAGRMAVFAALAAVGVTLGRRARSKPRNSETCVNRGICRGCSAFDECGLPQAMSAKRAKREG